MSSVAEVSLPIMLLMFFGHYVGVYLLQILNIYLTVTSQRLALEIVRFGESSPNCKVPHRLGRRTKGAIYRPGYLPLSTRFKAVRGEDSPKRTISRARRWDVTCYRSHVSRASFCLKIGRAHV